jgi:hypothetical protein
MKAEVRAAVNEPTTIQPPVRKASEVRAKVQTILAGVFILGT